MEIAGLVVLWVIISVMVGIAANARGQSGFGWFLIAIFISPLLALLFLLAFPSQEWLRTNKSDDKELQRNVCRGQRDLGL